MGILNYLVAMWVLGGLGFLFTIVTIGDNALFEEKGRLPANQTVALGFLVGVFAPLVLPAIATVAVSYGVYWLAGGFKGLWRTFFPKAVQLPKARIHVDTK